MTDAPRRLPFLSVIESDDAMPVNHDLETYREIRTRHATEIRRIDGVAANAKLEAAKWMELHDSSRAEVAKIRPLYDAVVAAIRVIEDGGE